MATSSQVLTGQTTGQLASVDGSTSQKEPPRAPGGLERARARYAGGVLASAWLVPIVAAIVAVAEYVAPHSLPGWAQVSADRSALTGAIVGLLSWPVLAAFLSPLASARASNASIFGELHERLSRLSANLETLTAQKMTSAYIEACQHRDRITAELESDGPQWVLATGYVNLWRRLHRAEEALIDIEGEEDVYEDATHDEQRMSDSTMAHTAGLIAKLTDARKFLANNLAKKLQSTDSTVNSIEEARSVVHSMRYTINDFRDQRWGGLVRARNLLVTTTILTELFIFILLALVVVEGVPQQALVAAMVFFVVGSVVGLFNRLNQTVGAGTVVEDYSLSTTRAILTPMISGLAAIGGVVLTPMVTMSGLTGIVQSATATGSSTQIQLPPLQNIFDLNQFRVGLVLAAVFGWTPSLLTNRLQQLTDRYKEDLKSTQTSV